MHPKWASFFARLMQVEEALVPILPIFIHNPASQRLVAAILVAEETAINTIFGANPAPVTATTDTPTSVPKPIAVVPPVPQQ